MSLQKSLDALDKYLKETSKEKILEDFEKTKYFDGIGITLDEYLDQLEYLNENGFYDFDKLEDLIK